MGQAIKYYIFILFLLWQTIAFAKPNAIDSIKTDADVLKFIQHHFNNHLIEQYDTFSLKYPEHPDPDMWRAFEMFDSIVDQHWLKADFDKNGLTDLFVTGFSGSAPLSCLILSAKNGQYSPQKFFNQCRCPFFKIISRPDDFLFINYCNWCSEYHCEVVGDTLVYKNGQLLEYNPHPSNVLPDSIVLSYPSSNPYADARISLKRNGLVSYTNYTRKDEPSSIKHCKKYFIKKKRLIRLLQLAEYIDTSGSDHKYFHGYEPDGTLYWLDIYFPGKPAVHFKFSETNAICGFLIKEIFEDMTGLEGH